jgi:glucuronate isomerase
MDDNFLLHSEAAQELYHAHAAQMPIIDYHCHLDPRLVAEDHRFRSVTELWLGGDHYKWRAMRANGVAEQYCTGDASDWEKFEQWAATVPYTMRNPLYHWTHLELRTAFGIDTLLSPATAREIFDECNRRLTEPEFSACGLMRRYRVEIVCTTDDPVDTLEWHARLASLPAAQQTVRMLPTWRPDKAMAIDDSTVFVPYVRRLAEVGGQPVTSYATLLRALRLRHDFFAAHGCRLSDHGIDEFYAEDFTEREIERIFARTLSGECPTQEETAKFKSAMLLAFAEMDHEKDWVQQFHYGALRNNNTRMLLQVGPDIGFDSIADPATARSLSRFLDRLDRQGKLPRTILYNLNPSANEMLATMAGNFQDGSCPGKIQFGAAWWFLDQKEGIERQLNALSSLGLLSRFVGMLTDSRSFLSYPRHDYFRRILCNLLGNDLTRGELPPSEFPFLAQFVRNLSYHNAHSFFRF